MTSPTATAALADPPSGNALMGSQRRNLIFVAVLLGMLLAALDQTIVATALPTVVADLGGAGHQSWVVTSYLLASTIVTAIVGKLGDLFGRKAVFQAAVVFFLVGSVLCGLSGSMTMLVASRALQGIGGGAIMVTATALIGEVIPLRHRGRYQSALGAVFGVTTVVGPLLGGFFTDHLSWRWAFWINVPVAVVVFIVAAGAIPALAKTARPVIDYAGIVFVGLGASGLTLATSWGDGEYAWNSPVIIGLFIVSAAALAVFVWVETRAAEPILPVRLFRSPVFAVCCVLGFIVGFAMLGALTFLPTFMQFVDGVSATESGLRTLPMVAGLLMTSMGSGVIVSRTGRYKIFPIIGTAVMVVGFVLLSRMDATTPTLLQSLYLFILGTGIGLCMQVLILIVQNTSSSRIWAWRHRVSRSSARSVVRSARPSSARCSPTSSTTASGRPWRPAVRRRRLRSPRRRCMNCRPIWPLPLSTSTPIRSAWCSCAPLRWRWSASSWRSCSKRFRCARWKRPAPSTSAKDSGCRAPNRRRSCWRPPSDG